jgi:hydrogenase expression/formation protein HypD
MLERIHRAQLTIDRACRGLGRQINIMEVCGTHTVAIFRHGIRSVLPENLRLLSGPGCPVCVTQQGYIDAILYLAGRGDCLIATYGDMIRVPGSKGSLETRHPDGNVRVVMSSEDALNLAGANPGRTVVFAAVGFETTAPATAVAVREAAAAGVENFCILCGHKLVVPAMAALLSGKNDRIDAFLCPGHVSAITGFGSYRPIAAEFKRPCVVAGFEPVQILEGIAAICGQLAEGRAEADSVYTAVVTEEGNATARRIIAECFDAADGLWRGLGVIEKSTLRLKDDYGGFDASRRFPVEEYPAAETSGCRCGEVLCGLIDPPQCTLFGSKCTPTDPVGPCMVSSEGACAAHFKYGAAAGGRS